MKNSLLLGVLIWLSVACSRNADVAPTLSGEVAGTYQTNGFLDYLCVALPTGQMPTVTLTRETATAVTLTYLATYPSNQTTTLAHVTLTRQPDNSIQLTQQGKVIGTTQIDRAFNANGMERQAWVLRLQTSTPNSQAPIAFTGAKE